MEDLTTWADRLEDTLRENEIQLFDRVFVLKETASTQNAAARLSGGRAGAIVLAGRQTAGRGRLGRTWQSEGSLTITFVVDAARFAASHVSLAGGLAVAIAVEKSVPGTGFQAALRWPNDVVEALPAGPPVSAARKISGMLVEVSGSLALVGIGINVLQKEDDWPVELRGRAVSCGQLGSKVLRLDVAERLVVELAKALRMGREALCDAWRRRSILEGRRVTFCCSGERLTGVVESLTPDLEIVLRSDDGVIHRLPAAQTSLVHEA